MCNCFLCKRGRKFDKIIKKYNIKGKDKEWLLGFYDSVLCTELERDVDELILKGEWHSAEYQLKQGLKKIEKKENKIILIEEI